MAKFALDTNDALVKKAWDEKLYRDTIKDPYFSKFMGTGSDSLIQVKSQLDGKQGDRITFGLRVRLTGNGVTSGTVLEGNEEKLVTYSMNLNLEQYRHAVRDAGAMDRQRAMFSVTEESRMALKDWGTEKIDALCFNALTDSPTKVFYINSSSEFTAASAATATTGIVAASKLQPNFISYIKTWAKTGGARTQTPLRPVKIDGKEYYVLLTHPDNLYDLKTNSTYQQFLRDAEERSKTNPLFTGAVAIIDGVVIHEHENIPVATNGGGGSVAYSKSVFMGAQSLCWAYGQKPETVQKTFDYDNEIGIGWSMIAGVAKTKFNSLDFGSVGVYLARTNVSGA